jgi:hypothetical protein
MALTCLRRIGNSRSRGCRNGGRVRRGKRLCIEGATAEIGIGLAAVIFVAIAIALALDHPVLVAVLVVTVGVAVATVRRFLPDTPYLAATLPVCIPLDICVLGLIALRNPGIEGSLPWSRCGGA